MGSKSVRDSYKGEVLELTTKELSQLYYLNREIENCQRKLEELEYQRGCRPVILDDMPHGKGPAKSRVEQLAAEIVDLKAIIHAKQIECIHERNRLERYIADIPDSITRQIFEYRFADCLPWEQVAACMGGENSGESVRKRCNRYLKSTENANLVTECPV